MASCKDCINYDVCSTKGANCDRGNNCVMYKDRNRFVEQPTVGYLISIPVRIGAYVYFIKSAFSYLKEPKQEMVRKIRNILWRNNYENRKTGVLVLKKLDKTSIPKPEKLAEKMRWRSVNNEKYLKKLENSTA